MAKGKGGENSKKAAGQGRKAEAAARKQAEAEAQAAAEEDQVWEQGSKKKNAKKEEEEAKREEARRKKAEREQLLEMEAAENKSKPQSSKNKGRDKIMARRGGGIDAALAAAEGGSLSARNIDDAISALQIAAGKDTDKAERHPERRFKPALRAYEERRLPEIREEHPGLRLNQYKELIFKEFEKSAENPFNQVSVDYNAKRGDVREALDKAKKAKEDRLRG